MTKRIRATFAAAGVAIAGLLVIAAYFGAFSSLFKHGSDYPELSGRERIELMPPNSKEYSERHVVGPNGKDLKTVVQYRNGDRGVKLYRTDNTLKEWTIEFAAGGVRLHAIYAADGQQVILGEQMREDRTMLWKATNADSLVTLTEYYYDGKVPFSVVTRQIGASVQDAQYFRKDGTPWLRQVGDRAKADKPELEQVWDSAGKLVYERRVVDKEGKTTTVTYYRPDGTASFKQTWVEHQSSSGYDEEYGYGGYGGYYYPSTTTTLRTVEEYAENGSLVTRRSEWDENGVKLVSQTTNQPDGSSVTVVDESKMTPVGDDLKKSLPTAPTPRSYWKEQENDVSKRGNPAP